MGDGEKRTARRKAIALRIKLRYDGVETFIAKFATNISRAGLFIRGKNPKATGTLIRFELQLADGSSVVSGSGEVRWTRPYDPDNPRKPYGMGIAFSKLDQESQEMIEMIVARRTELGHKFEPGRIPFRLPTAVEDDSEADRTPSVPNPSSVAEAPASAESQSGESPVAEPVPSAQRPPAEPAPTDHSPDFAKPAASLRKQLAPEAKKRPRATLDEVMARAETAAAPKIPELELELELELEGSVSIANALERAHQITEVGTELFDELGPTDATVQATPREASERLAALFGDLPVPGRRRKDVHETEPNAAPDVSDESAEAENEVSEADVISETSADQEPSEPLEVSAEPAPPFQALRDQALHDQAQPASATDLQFGPNLELPGSDDESTNVDQHEPLDPVPGSFADEAYEARTVARPDLAAALADAAEIVASADRSVKGGDAPHRGDSAAKEFDDPHAASTKIAPRIASAFGRNISEPELDDDIDAALEALIPDSIDEQSEVVPMLKESGSVVETDFDIGDHVGFHRISTGDVVSENEDDLFPPITETETSVVQDDYIISFQHEAEPENPEPDATFARAQAAIDEVIGQFEQPSDSSMEPVDAIDLEAHVSLESPNSEVAPTFITDMPSAALASDLVHDSSNKIGGGRQLDSLLLPAEPFIGESDGPVHGIGDFFDPQPLSEEVSIDQAALAGPPPTPRPPPIPVKPPKPLGRPPDTIPPSDLLDEPQILARVNAPGLPALPEEDIDISLDEFDNLDDFDESPQVVAGAPIPTEITEITMVDELAEGEVPDGDENEPAKKRGLFGRLFRKP